MADVDSINLLQTWRIGAHRRDPGFGWGSGGWGCWAWQISRYPWS